MSERISIPRINRKDLDLILEVNKKVIEIETEAVAQNEEIINLLSDNKKKQGEIDTKIDKIVKQNDDLKTDAKKDAEEIKRELFKIQVLFVTGLLSLVIQIIQIFIKK